MRHLARTVELLGEELKAAADDIYRDVDATSAAEARRIAAQLDTLSDRLYRLETAGVA